MRVAPIPPIALVATALPLLLLLSAPAHAQRTKPARRALVGVVLDSATGKPLSGAVVDLGKREVVTDSAGRFRLGDVSDGPVQLSASQLGYEDRDVEVTVVEGMPPVAIALAADPVKLQAITVMADRFRSRRNSVPVSVQAYDRKTLLSSGAYSLWDFLEFHAPMIAQHCTGGEGGFGGGPFGLGADGGGLCVLVRGRWMQPSVWIDERPAFSDELMDYNPSDLYLVEVYGRGRMIRAYTTWFVETSRGRRLDPIW